MNAGNRLTIQQPHRMNHLLTLGVTKRRFMIKQIKGQQLRDILPTMDQDIFGNFNLSYLITESFKITKKEWAWKYGNHQGRKNRCDNKP